MTVKELITILSKFNENHEVRISDGFDFNFYHTNGAVIEELEEIVDIGIGGCLLDDEDDGYF